MCAQCWHVPGFHLTAQPPKIAGTNVALPNRPQASVEPKLDSWQMLRLFSDGLIRCIKSDSLQLFQCVTTDPTHNVTVPRTAGQRVTAVCRWMNCGSQCRLAQVQANRWLLQWVAFRRVLRSSSATLYAKHLPTALPDALHTPFSNYSLRLDAVRYFVVVYRTVVCSI